MGSRTVTGGEGLSRYNECRCVRTKVLEEIGKAVEENESVCASCRGGKLVISKAFGKK